MHVANLECRFGEHHVPKELITGLTEGSLGSAKSVSPLLAMGIWKRDEI